MISDAGEHYAAVPLSGDRATRDRICGTEPGVAARAADEYASYSRIFAPGRRCQPLVATSGAVADNHTFTTARGSDQRPHVGDTTKARVPVSLHGMGGAIDRSKEAPDAA